MALPIYDLTPQGGYQPVRLGDIGASFFGAFDKSRAREQDLKKQQLLSELGQNFDASRPDSFVAAGQKLLALGDVKTGSELLKYGADLADKQASTAAGAQFMGGGSPAPAVGATMPAPPPAVDAGALSPLFQAKEQQYGTPPGYLARTAQIESGMNPAAKNPNSSAAGLFQFVDGTAGQYGLSNPLDPVASTDAAARLARDNISTLKTRLNRAPTAAELYLAHQQGAAGAAALLNNPDARAADIVGADAVRLNGGSADMTAGQFAQKWLTKFGGAAGQTGQGGGAPVQVAQAGPGPAVGGQDRSSGGVLSSKSTADLEGALANPRIPANVRELVKTELDFRRAKIKTPDEIRRDQLSTRQLELAVKEAEKKGTPAPTVRVVKQADGSEVAVQWDDRSGQWVPLKAPEGGNPVSSPKLTEVQSKDVGFYNRAQKILPRLEEQDKALTSGLSAAGSAVPIVGNYLKSDAYRQAEQTGRELMAVILRKDSGAAVTPSEMDLYGSIYLPRPSDDAATIEQKRVARRTAIEGIKMGLGTADILFRDRQALEAKQSPNAATAAQPGVLNRTKTGDVWSVVQ